MNAQHEEQREPLAKKSFEAAYREHFFLAHPGTNYRRITGELAKLTRSDDADLLKEMLESFSDPELAANAVYAKETDYYTPDACDLAAGSTPGPMFEDHGPMVESFYDFNGIRLLGLALRSQAYNCVSFLIKLGAKIPGSPDFPEKALQSKGKAGYNHVERSGICEVITRRGGGTIEDIQAEYLSALDDYLARAANAEEKMERQLLLSTLKE